MDKKRLQLAIQALSPSSALLPVYGEGSRTTVDYRKEGTLILKPLLEDLVYNQSHFCFTSFPKPSPRLRCFPAQRRGPRRRRRLLGLPDRV